MAIMQTIWRKLGDVLGLGYDAAESSRFRADLGWARQSPRSEEGMVAGDQTREKLRLRAQDLRRNNPVIAGVCNRMASFTLGSTGLLPQARTPDEKWNREAEQFWADWSGRADYRGLCTLYDLQWLAVSLRPIQGGLYLQLMANGTVNPIECERIRQPTDTRAAADYVDGVYLDRTTGQIRGYQVHSRDKDGAFSGEHKDEYITANNMLRWTTPLWRIDQVREIPDLAPLLSAFQDAHEMNEYTLNTAKWQSQVLAALKKNANSGGGIGPRTNTPSVGERQTFRTDWGQIYQLFPGEEIDLKRSETPSQMHIPYMRFQLLLAASALDVPYEFFTLDFSTADYSRMKSVLMLSNKSMRNWSAWMARNLTRLWNWRIAKAVANKELPPAPSVDGVSQWNRVEWQSPAEPWVDQQESNQADMLAWQLGLAPLSVAAKRRGGDLEDLLREKARNIVMANAIEKEMGLPANTLIQAQMPGQTLGNSGDAGDDNKKQDTKEGDEE